MDEKNKLNLVKNLRQATSLPIGECRKILEEANWSMENIEGIIEKYNQKLAMKKQGRTTQEGRIFTLFKENLLYYVFIACETDFVASNEKFLALGKEIVGKISNNDLNFENMFIEPMAVLNEKIEIGSMVINNENKQALGSFECNYFYCHNGKKMAAVKTNTDNIEFNRHLVYHMIAMVETLDMSGSIENQPWYLNENEKVSDFLKKNSIELYSSFFLAI